MEGYPNSVLTRFSNGKKKILSHHEHRIEKVHFHIAKEKMRFFVTTSLTKRFSVQSNA